MVFTTISRLPTISSTRIAARFLPRALSLLARHGVEVRGCERTRLQSAYAGIEVKPVEEADFDAEYLDLIIAARVVDSLPDALAHIARHGSDHTEVIVTEDASAAEAFIRAESGLDEVEALRFLSAEPAHADAWRVRFAERVARRLHEATVARRLSDFSNPISCHAAEAKPVPQFALEAYEATLEQSKE
jgi:hypothetical protein